MPVVAQGCKPKRPVQVVNAGIMAPSSRPIKFEDDSSDLSDLDAAILNAQKTRAEQAKQATAFLESIDKNGRHPYAGKNVRIKSSTSDTVGITGYVTDKGLFKQWTDSNLMTRSGKYGCPAPGTVTDLMTYSVPAPNKEKGSYIAAKTNYGSYVGAPITGSSPTMFMGTQIRYNPDAELPACGNEGSNVQVVYPAKATKETYRGTFILSSEMKERQQSDLTSVSYEACKRRAEDRGAIVFGITGNKCYLGDDVSSAQVNGIAYVVEGVSLSQSNAPQNLLHLGKDGTFNLLSSSAPSNNDADIVKRFGLPKPHEIPIIDGAPQTTKCDFKNGGRIAAQPFGTWGENCNALFFPAHGTGSMNG